MFFIIWGSRDRVSEIGKGEFFCPHCGKKHPYVHKKAKRWFTLYFIPVFPTQDLGEFIECTVCHMTFRVDVLNYKPKRESSLPPLQEQLNMLRSQLERGTSVEYVIRDLTTVGLEREIAQGAVKSVTGDRVNKCPSCALTYASNVTTCKECGGTLVAKTAPA